MKPRFIAKALETKYWLPGEDYLGLLTKSLIDIVCDGDIVTISEKALAIAKGQIFDESRVKAGFLAKILVRFWMRIVWNKLLGPICHLKTENIKRIKNYPLDKGSVHKQVALWYTSFLQALLWGSEGGIDASNLPYSYVSLPLYDPQKTADTIHMHLTISLKKKLIIMIVDTDKTYSYGRFHFTHRSNSIQGIHSRFGFISYVLGRALRLRCRSTPLAVSGTRINVDIALDLADLANKRRGSGAGATVWDMAEKLGVGITDVTWTMLKRFRHRPIVVIRVKGRTKFP